MSSGAEPHTQVLAPGAFVVRFDHEPSFELSRRLIGIAAAYRELPGVVDGWAGHRTVMVECLPERLSELIDLRIDAEPIPLGRTHRIPVRYDGEDLPVVADLLDMTSDDVVALHSSRDYLVTMIGSPGFIYLSETDHALRVPRLDMPRQHVPAGSVGLAGRQTGIYGMARPGGWRIIGTAEQLPQPEPGDLLRMVPS